MFNHNRTESCSDGVCSGSRPCNPICCLGPLALWPANTQSRASFRACCAPSFQQESITVHRESACLHFSMLCGVCDTGAPAVSASKAGACLYVVHVEFTHLRCRALTLCVLEVGGVKERQGKWKRKQWLLL